jgi:5-oxoprolinase (ATP-hydrolysing)
MAIDSFFFAIKWAETLGTDTSMMTGKPSAKSMDYLSEFVSNYKLEFGFTLPDRPVIIDGIRVRGIGKGASENRPVPLQEIAGMKKFAVTSTSATLISSVYWEQLGRHQTPVYQLSSLKSGSEVEGPALIIDKTSTIAVQPGCMAVVTSEHVVITIGDIKTKSIGHEVDPVMLSVFGHRFMSIAEQMGKTLQKTSISTNIKERLDFSCALFGPDGGLVANAPHIPVHLGSMQEAVRWQLKFFKNELADGDVLMTNHPQAGGSHLPDITVITPVFDNGEIVFFVGSRGHHSDIGGIQP